jgi:SAM-dependent methyltransferase
MPSNSELYQYAFDSDLARYRASDEYQYLFRTLRQELWNGQIEWAEGRICRHLKMDRYRVLDWGPRMTGWIEIARKAAFVGEYVLAEPLPPLSTDGEPTQCEVVLLFDVLQRHAHPDKLLARIFSALKPGGLLLLTSRSGTGFDILTLADESESIFPLDHVCLPSPQGLKMSLEQAGFTVLELTTPGLLDVQLVRQGKNNIPISHYFQRYVINQFGTDMHERLQAFLQQNNLSSHMRAVAVKGSCND